MEGSLSDRSSEIIRAEVSAIRDLLKATHPAFWSARQSLELGPDAAAFVRLFWSEIGYAEAVGWACPDADSTRAAIDEMRRAARDDPWVELKDPKLPSRLHLVSASFEDAPFGVEFTDETTGAADPPVYAWLSECPELILSSPSYLRYVGSRIALSGIGRWPSKRIGVNSTLRGVRPFPNVAPDAVRLSENVWIRYGLPEAPNSAFCTMFFRSIADLEALLTPDAERIIPMAGLGLGAMAGTVLEIHGPAVRDGPLRRSLHIAGQDPTPETGGTHWFGRIRGAAAWVFEPRLRREAISVALDAPHAAPVVAYLRSEGYRVGQPFGRGDTRVAPATTRAPGRPKRPAEAKAKTPRAEAAPKASKKPKARVAAAPKTPKSKAGAAAARVPKPSVVKTKARRR